MADLLSIGKTGLMVSKKSLETTGHNIANASTEGYSRQRVNVETNNPISTSGLVFGTGARVRDVSRTHDPFVEKRLQSTTTAFNYFDQRTKKLTEVENIFNEIDNEGLNKVLNKFFNAFRDLANQPENETVRSVVRDTAGLVVKDFKRIRGTLDAISRSVDNKIKSEVNDLNESIKHIAKLNKQIAELEVFGGETGDFRDQRETHMRTLSESFQIHTFEDEKGSFNVMAKNVGSLVSGTQYQELAAGRVQKKDSSNNMDGSMEIYFKNRPGQKITHRFKSGKIQGLFQVRNGEVQDLQKSIDKIAYNLMQAVNAVHRRGFVNREIKVDQAGNPAKFDAQGPLTNIDFFDLPNQEEEAATNIKINNIIMEDSRNIATGMTPNGPGDNRIALGVSKLQHERILDGGKATLEEAFLETIGSIGLETGKAKFDREQAEGILVQTKNIKDRISGVSIDEETANMVRYQHVYQASAKVMQTANTLFDTVLSIKR
ncbi:MAG: flagellar hook-associated protein FlgK [Halobacteriovoraceae bacterium]|nr:flagellar hook-associated protein FlgK [Halobacteriovoraceae bacterium]MBT5095925.1 flagellar hook-associated protein FlgK [Halobacteriovoraceae bacterium]